jgi:cytochrome P450
LTLQIVLRTILSSPRGNLLSELHARLLAMLDVTASAVLAEPVLRRGPGLRTWKGFLRERTEVDRLLYAFIDARKNEPTAENDLLAMLLAGSGREGRPASREQIRDNLMSIILAGHETTASQLAWAFQLLAYHPAVQRRLIDEIDSETGDTYMTATIQEVLRHRTVFLFAIPRAVKQPIDIGGRNYHPPAHLLACVYLVHHDPTLYPEPYEFRPERFLDKPPDPHAWIPWGGGRRRYPGSHLAMLEMKTVLRAVLSEMTVHPAARKIERPRWRSVIVTPHAGSRVVLRRRHHTRRPRAGIDTRTDR